MEKNLEGSGRGPNVKEGLRKTIKISVSIAGLRVEI
jgi:hypothetical protein